MGVISRVQKEFLKNSNYKILPLKSKYRAENGYVIPIFPFSTTASKHPIMEHVTD